MQDTRTGMMQALDPGMHEAFRRIFAAGEVVMPLFAVGDVVEIRNGNFRVVAIDRHLLVLEGIPAQYKGNQ